MLREGHLSGAQMEPPLQVDRFGTATEKRPMGRVSVERPIGVRGHQTPAGPLRGPGQADFPVQIGPLHQGHPARRRSGSSPRHRQRIDPCTGRSRDRQSSGRHAGRCWARQVCTGCKRGGIR